MKTKSLTGRPAVGFGSPAPKNKRVKTQRGLRLIQSINHTEDDFINAVIDQLPNGFSNDPSGFINNRRQLLKSEYKLRHLMMNAAASMKQRQLLTTPLDAVTILDNGPFDFIAAKGFWRFQTSHHHRYIYGTEGLPINQSEFSPWPDFEFDVKLCNEFMCHPQLVSDYLAELTKDYWMTAELASQWKRLVMAEFQTISQELLAAYRRRYPTQSLWSFTVSDVSHRLIRQAPDVHLEDGLAFIFGGAK